MRTKIKDTLEKKSSGLSTPASPLAQSRAQSSLALDSEIKRLIHYETVQNQAENLRKSHDVSQKANGRTSTLDGLMSAREATYDLLRKQEE